MIGGPEDLRLNDEQEAWLRHGLAGPIVGFSTQGGAFEPPVVGRWTPGGAVQFFSRHVFRASQLIVHSTESTEINTTSVDVAPRDEVFPIATGPWRPELLEPWAYRPAVAPIDPTAEAGLDLTTPLGRVVEISVFSIAEPPFGEVEGVTEFDTASSWRSMAGGSSLTRSFTPTTGGWALRWTSR